MRVVSRLCRSLRELCSRFPGGPTPEPAFRTPNSALGISRAEPLVAPNGATTPNGSGGHRSHLQTGLSYGDAGQAKPKLIAVPFGRKQHRLGHYPRSVEPRWAFVPQFNEFDLLFGGGFSRGRTSLGVRSTNSTALWRTLFMTTPIGELASLISLVSNTEVWPLRFTRTTMLDGANTEKPLARRVRRYPLKRLVSPASRRISKTRLDRASV